MRYVYALGTRPLAQYGTAWEYLLADARPCPTLHRSVGGPLGVGSVRQIVDGSGNVTLAESYEPYGSVLSSDGTASSIFGYSGEQIDTSGLVFLRARYMQPTLGIFLARDPWGGDVMRPGSMNGWNYGLGNPINRVDPSGWFSRAAIANSFFKGASWSQLLNSSWMAKNKYWGLLGALLKAKSGDTLFFGRTIDLPDISWSPMYQIECNNGEITLNGLSITQVDDFGLSTDLATGLFGGSLWWRQETSLYPHYYLLNAVDLFADDTGGNLLPDFRGYNLSANVSVLAPAIAEGITSYFKVPQYADQLTMIFSVVLKDVGVSYLEDRFGNKYLAGFAGTGASPVLASGQYLEGYVGRDISNPSPIPTEADIKETLPGICGDLSGNISALYGSISRCLSGSPMAMYGISGFALASGSAHLSFSFSLDIPQFSGLLPSSRSPLGGLMQYLRPKDQIAWDYLFTWPRWSKDTFSAWDWLADIGFPPQGFNECDDCNR